MRSGRTVIIGRKSTVGILVRLYNANLIVESLNNCSWYVDWGRVLLLRHWIGSPIILVWRNAIRFHCRRFERAFRQQSVRPDMRRCSDSAGVFKNRESFNRIVDSFNWFSAQTYRPLILRTRIFFVNKENGIFLRKGSHSGVTVIVLNPSSRSSVVISVVTETAGTIVLNHSF